MELNATFLCHLIIIFHLYMLKLSLFIHIIYHPTICDVGSRLTPMKVVVSWLCLKCWRFRRRDPSLNSSGVGQGNFKSVAHQVLYHQNEVPTFFILLAAITSVERKVNFALSSSRFLKVTIAGPSAIDHLALQRTTNCMDFLSLKSS